MTLTYNSETKHGRAGPAGSNTYGGYSTNMVVHQHFGVKLPADYPLEKAGADCQPPRSPSPLPHFPDMFETCLDTPIIPPPLIPSQLGWTLSCTQAKPSGAVLPPRPANRSAPSICVLDMPSTHLRRSCPLASAHTGPLMCAAITTWDPLRHWKAGPGTRVGIAGMGGLGMMGCLLAKAMGCGKQLENCT